MHVTLQKREKGQPWPSAIAGHAPLDPLKTEQEKQRLMLERFQEEVRSMWKANADSDLVIALRLNFSLPEFESICVLLSNFAFYIGNEEFLSLSY